MPLIWRNVDGSELEFRSPELMTEARRILAQAAAEAMGSAEDTPKRRGRPPGSGKTAATVPVVTAEDNGNDLAAPARGA